MFAMSQFWIGLGLMESKSADRYGIRISVFGLQETNLFHKDAKAIGTAVLNIIKSFYLDFEQACVGTNPSAHGVPPIYLPA